MDSFLAAATWLAIGFHRITAEGTHHIATSVSGPIRRTLFWAPMSFTSLTSLTYKSLSSAGGGPTRNCDGLLITQGVTRPQPGSEAGAKAGGVGTQTPALPAPGALYGNCAVSEPSIARKARTCAATFSPTSIPGSDVVRPRAASELPYRASSAACWFG